MAEGIEEEDTMDEYATDEDVVVGEDEEEYTSKGEKLVKLLVKLLLESDEAHQSTRLRKILQI